MSSRSAILAGLAGLLVAGAVAAQPWSGGAGLEVRATSHRGPVAGAVVRLAYRSETLGTGPAPVATDGTGRATLTGLAAGTWQVEVSHPDFMTFVAVVELAADDKPEVTASFLEATETSTTTLRVRIGKARGPASPPLPTAPPAPIGATPPAPEPEPPAPAPAAPESAPAEPSPAPEAEAPAPEPESAPPEPASPAAPEAHQPAEPEAPPEAEAPAAPESAPAEPTPAPEAEAPAPEPESAPTAPEAPAPPGTQRPAEPEAPPEAEAPAAPGSAPAEPTPAPEAEAPAPEPESTPAAPETPTAPEAPAAPETQRPAEPQAPPEAEAPAVPEGAPAEPVPAPGPGEPQTTLPDEAISPAEEAPLPEAEGGGEAAPAVPPVEPLRSYSRRTCVECRPGEWAAAERVVSRGGDPCSRNDLDGLDAAMQAVAETDALELHGYAGPLGPARALLDAATLHQLDAALAGLPSGCGMAAVVLPRNARFSAFQYEHSAGGPRAACLPDRPCTGSTARWHGPPHLARGANATLAYGLFQAEAPEAGYLTVYFQAADPGWKPSDTP